MSEKPTKEELREAIEDACDCLHGVLNRSCTNQPIRFRAAETLRAFLDSGLTDSERETVRMVREEMIDWWQADGAAGNEATLTPIEVCMPEWVAALAPIAEKGKTP